MGSLTEGPAHGEPVIPIESLLLELLIERGWTIAVAESLTAGTAAARLCACPGSGDRVLGGVVSYSTAAKQRVLGVDPGDGVVGPEAALAMAEGVRGLFGSDVGLSTTGVAGPEELDGQPVGTVQVGWATPRGGGTAQLSCSGTPEQIRSEAATAALRVLLDRATDQKD